MQQSPSLQPNITRPNYEDYYLYQKETPEDQREVTYTAKGRRVLGQGGISPDYEVKFSFEEFVYNMAIKGTFFDYAKKFKDKIRPVSKDYIFPDENSPGDRDPNRKNIDQNFTVGQDIIDDFKASLRDENIEFDESKFEESREEIGRELEREIHSAFWGIEMGIKAYRKTDQVVQKAIEVMPEAIALIQEDTP